MRFCVIAFGPLMSLANGYFLRSYYLLSHLAQLNKVVVLEFSETHQSSMEVKGNTRFVRLGANEVKQNMISRQMTKILTFDLLHQVKFQVESLADLFIYRHYIKNCDVCFIEGALIPSATILARVFRKKVVLDTHAVNKRLAITYKEHNRLAYLLRASVWHVLESIAFALSNHVIVVSEEEKDFIMRAYNVKESKIHVVQNASFLSEYSMRDVENLREKWHLKKKIIVTFVGDSTVVHNRDATRYIANELAPSFLSKRPDVAFVVAGRSSPLGDLSLPNLIFTGFMKDLGPLLELSDICIAPLRVGCGVKTKVLQYMAHGKPIVTTPLGVEGIETKDLKALIVTSIAAFEDALLEALRSKDQLKDEALHNNDIFRQKYSRQSFDKSFGKCLEYVTRDV